jgi:tripartite-type tricarboxylate transporter receptor subunit TctC
MKRIISVIAFCLVITSVGFTVDAFAQDYPAKPVQVIVPFTAGSATDVIARAVSQKLSELWGQPVVVENHPGAGGTVGAGVVATSAPDGHTLLMHSSAHTISAALYAKLPYDILQDFVAIAPIARQAFVLVVSPSAGLKSVSELIAAAKAKPGAITFGSSGIGSATHFAAERFKLAAGVEVAHVPNQGGPEANADTMAGRVTYWFPPITTALKEIREGKLLALGVTSAQRSSVVPEVPTMAEVGVSGFEAAGWSGIWAPAGIPSGVVEKLAKDVARALAAPDLLERFAKLGNEPMSMTSEEFARFVRSEMESAARIVKAAGITPQ